MLVASRNKLVASSFKQVKKGFLSMSVGRKYHVLWLLHNNCLISERSGLIFFVVDHFISLNFMRKKGILQDFRGGGARCVVACINLWWSQIGILFIFTTQFSKMIYCRPILLSYWKLLMADRFNGSCCETHGPRSDYFSNDYDKLSERSEPKIFKIMQNCYKLVPKKCILGRF